MIFSNLATFGSVGFSGYQILSSKTELSENVNLQGIHYKNPLTSAKFDQTVSFPISNPHSTIFVIRTNSQIINQNIFAKLNSSLESWDQESVNTSMDHSGVAKYYHILAMGY